MNVQGDRPTALSLVAIAAGFLLVELTGSGTFAVLILGGMVAGVVSLIRLMIRNPGPTKDPVVIYCFLAFVVLLLTAGVIHEKRGTGIQKITVGSI
jgi:hypothetical protein